jgi:DnaJ-related protein SCJ1
VQQFQVHCEHCGGKGTSIKKSCRLCKQKKLKSALDDLHFFIAKGTPDGYEQAFKEAGDQLIDLESGDV